MCGLGIVKGSLVGIERVGEVRKHSDGYIHPLFSFFLLSALHDAEGLHMLISSLLE